MENTSKLFEEFWMDYQRSVEFTKLWGDVTEYQRFGFIAEDFVKWLINKGHIRKVE